MGEPAGTSGDFDVRLCDSKTAYQVVPKRRMSLKLTNMRNALDEAGVVLALTPYVAVLKARDGSQFSIYSSGKILFLSLLDRDRAREIASRVYSLLGAGRS